MSANRKFDVASSTVSIMQSIAADRASLESSVSGIAKAIIADTAQGMVCFTAARGLYLQAKETGAHAGVAADWTRFAKAVWNHFDRANLRATWPNLRSGEGDFILMSKDEATESNKARAVERAEKAKSDLAAFKQQQQQQQIDQVKAMSPEAMAAHIAHLLSVWGGDAQSQMNVIQSVMGGIEKRLIAQSAAELRRNNKAAQAAAKREAERTQKAATA